MAGLGTLTAGVMHEINNPTNFTHASLYNLRLKHDELFVFLHSLAGGDNADPKILSIFDEKKRELSSITDTAEEGTSRIKEIVSELSNFSRIDSDEKKSVDIKTVIETSINLVHTKYPTIVFDIEGTQSTNVLCFQSKISQVLLNLFINACQAIEQAMVDDLELIGKTTVSTKIKADTISIRVKDNGCGIKEEIVNNIFDPFFTTKDVGSGTGLGLSIAFSIIEEHGGTLKVSSEHNKGTIFTMKLPYQPFSS